MELEHALNLSPLTAWVYLVLSSGSVTPKLLAAAGGVSTRTIRRAIAQLREVGIEVQRNGQKATAKQGLNPAIIPDIIPAPEIPISIDSNEKEEQDPGQDIGELPAIIPDDLLLHIPVRPELDKILNDPAQELDTPPEHGPPPYNRGIPRRFCEPEEAPDLNK